MKILYYHISQFAYGRIGRNRVESVVKQAEYLSFKTSPSCFMIVLPNLYFHKEIKASRSEKTDPPEKVSSLMEQRAKLAVDIIKAKGAVSRMEVETVCGISRSMAAVWPDQLVNAGVLLRVGHSRNTKYTIAAPSKVFRPDSR